MGFGFWVIEHEIYEIEFDDYEEGALLFRSQMPKTHQLVCDKNGKDTNKEVAFKWEKGVGLTEYTGTDYDGNKITLQLVRAES